MAHLHAVPVAPALDGAAFRDSLWVPGRRWAGVEGFDPVELNSLSAVFALWSVATRLFRGVPLFPRHGRQPVMLVALKKLRTSSLREWATGMSWPRK